MNAPDVASDDEFVAVWKSLEPLLPLDKTITNINGPALLVEKLKSLDDDEVAAFLAPCNEQFWRKLVFACFDFTVSPNQRFNVHSNEWGSSFSNLDADEAIREYRREFGEARPSQILLEDFHWWTNLGIHFRPSQYGFLGRIQRGEATVDAAWPASEDAYTLFHELAMIKQVFGDMEGELRTFSDGEQFVNPVLSSKMDEPVTGFAVPLLKHCGFTPHFWAWRGADPVSLKWSHFDQRREQSEQESMRESYHIFPLGRDETIEEVKEVVVEWCCDWRDVHVNPEEYPSPAFYIGKTKNSKRWMGFLGRREY